MEIFCLAVSTFLVTGTVAFLAAEIPLKDAYLRIKQMLHDKAEKKRLLALMLLCFGLCIYGDWLFGIGREYSSFLLITSYLMAITPKDIKEHIISDRTTIIFAVVFALFRASSLEWGQLQDALSGVVVGVILLGLPYLIRKNSIGMGDIKTVCVCGILLGGLGTIYFLLRAFIAIFVYSVVQLLRKKVTLKSETPFAPFLLVAAII